MEIKLSELAGKPCGLGLSFFPRKIEVKVYSLGFFSTVAMLATWEISGLKLVITGVTGLQRLFLAISQNGFCS